MFKFTKPVTPDADAFIANLRRQGTPRRVHYLELFLDVEVQDAIVRQFGLEEGLDRNDPAFGHRRQIALQRFLGYDYVHVGLPCAMPTSGTNVQDTAGLAKAGGRRFMEEHKGPITTWEEFEKYPWPDMTKADDSVLQWYEKNLPEDMCIIGGGNAHFCEWLCWLMGYETLCYALYDDRPLVQAIYDKVYEIARITMQRLRQFKKVRAVWGSDDMGFKTGTLISPADTREFVLAGHKMAAGMAHECGWVYLLHACGNLAQIREDLIQDVRIDAKHSFEDTIELVTDAKREYGRRLTLLGGIDVDFLCRAGVPAIRQRVRQTLEVCLPGGGYCLGSGNSVANYIPVEHYLAMMDEGRRFANDP